MIGNDIDVFESKISNQIELDRVLALLWGTDYIGLRVKWPELVGLIGFGFGLSRTKVTRENSSICTKLYLLNASSAEVSES